MVPGCPCCPPRLRFSRSGAPASWVPAPASVLGAYGWSEEGAWRSCRSASPAALRVAGPEPRAPDSLTFYHNSRRALDCPGSGCLQRPEGPLPPGFAGDMGHVGSAAVTETGCRRPKYASSRTGSVADPAESELKSYDTRSTDSRGSLDWAHSSRIDTQARIVYVTHLNGYRLQSVQHCISSTWLPVPRRHPGTWYPGGRSRKRAFSRHDPGRVTPSLGAVRRSCGA